MEHLLILLVGGLIVLVRKLFMEGGLEKMLGKLDSDLNNPSEELRRTRPEPLQRPVPTSLSPEEERTRKFLEALGLPVDEPAPKPVAPPPVTQRTSVPTPVDRARRERERIERKLAERRRALQQPVPVATLPANQPSETTVSKYFSLEDFDRPPIEPEKTSVAVQVDTPIIEADFYQTLEKREAAPIPAANRLSEIFGSSSDLRRLILAHEILGRPKSLQNA